MQVSPSHPGPGVESAFPPPPWTLELLAPLEGERFSIDLRNGSHELVELLEIQPHGDFGGRRAFSLFFRADYGDRFLPQGCWNLSHPSVPALDVFLVPLGANAEGFMTYQAVFS